MKWRHQVIGGDDQPNVGQRLYVQKLATIGSVVSEITCLIKINTDARQTDIQTYRQTTFSYSSDHEMFGKYKYCIPLQLHVGIKISSPSAALYICLPPPARAQWSLSSLRICTLQIICTRVSETVTTRFCSCYNYKNQTSSFFLPSLFEWGQKCKI